MKYHHITFLIVLGWIVFVGLTSPLSATEPYVLSVQQLKAGMEKSAQPSQKGFILVDVRTPEEHAGGFIPGTDFNIDFREMQFRHLELHANLDEHIVVYCQSGHRSSIAAETLTDLGYNFVYNVAGSMNAWQEAGYPIEMPRR
ncbi:MAG: rhodanese-like domain-containing protein [Nitrospirales bacterium]|nr:rhodanese-like domain-containing protein [Nitrospirales bacterium]